MSRQEPLLLRLPSAPPSRRSSGIRTTTTTPTTTTRACPRSLLRSLVLLPLVLLVLLLAAAGPGSPRGALGARRPRPAPLTPRLTGAAAQCARRTKRAACGADALAVACGGSSSSTAALATASTCPDAYSTPCRVMAGGQPTECVGGVAFSLAPNGGGGGTTTSGVRLVRPAANSAAADAPPPVYVTGAITARGAGGSCAFSAPAGLLGSASSSSSAAAGARRAPIPPLLRAPATAVAYVDLCVCVPTQIDYYVVAAAAAAQAQAEDEDDAALLALATNPTPLLPAPLCPAGRGELSSVRLPNLTARDDCGREIPVTVEVASAPDEASKALLLASSSPSSLKPGGTVSRQGLACGVYELSYVAVLPDGGDLLASKEFAFEVLCDGLPDAGVLGGLEQEGTAPPAVPTCM
jgi:hypothetical protein